MSNRYARRMLLAAALCAAWFSGQVLAGMEIAVANTPVSNSKGQFSVQLPAGWVYQRSGYEVTTSRDGALLNNISFALRKHKKAFPAIKKDSTADALPEELAENYIADLKSRPGISDVQVVAIEPADLGGQPAFRVHLTYVLMQEMGGAPFEQVALGAPLPDYLLIASYAAPRIHFFATYLPAFEESLRTLTLATPDAKR
ncbi:MAG TPA: hypothetical protein VF851_06340 [Steroidobacteraceae bacterium]